jgi:hypothetical protein
MTISMSNERHSNNRGTLSFKHVASFTTLLKLYIQYYYEPLMFSFNKKMSINIFT